MGPARRASWAIIDQGLSSGTNFAIAFVVARTVSLVELGAFGIVFATYTVALGIARAVTTEPLAFRYSETGARGVDDAVRAATGASLVVGVLGSVASLGVALLIRQPTSTAFVALAVVLPGLLLQDALRLSFFVIRRPRSAAVNDAIWAVALVVAMVVLLNANATPPVETLLLAWGLAATFAACIGLAQLRLIPASRRAYAWMKAHRDIAPSYAGEFLSAAGSAQLVLYPVAFVTGLAATGALRAGLLLMGPLNIVFMGVALVAVPEAVALLRRSKAALQMGCLTLGAGLGLSAAAWGIALLLVPAGVGTALLKDAWDPAQDTIVPLTVWLAASGPVAGAALGARVLGRARENFVNRLGLGLVTVAAATAGAAVDHARGAAWGLALATLLGAVWWWWRFRRGLADAPSGPQTTLE